MDELSKELLDEIEQYAYCYMQRDEIATITGVALGRIFEGEDPAGIAFLTGRLKRKAEFNLNIIQLSKQLSSPAMAMERDIQQNTHLNDLKR